MRADPELTGRRRALPNGRTVAWSTQRDKAAALAAAWAVAEPPSVRVKFWMSAVTHAVWRMLCTAVIFYF